MTRWKVICAALVGAIALSVGPVGWGRLCRTLMQQIVAAGWVDPASAYQLGLPLVVFPFFLVGTLAFACLLLKRHAEVPLDRRPKIGA